MHPAKYPVLEKDSTKHLPLASEQTGRRLLAVFAHPDDESFGTGGTLALYAQRGVQVHLVCATRGEAGEAPSDFRGFASIGEMREHELRRAASILGLRSVYFLGYRDSGMPGSPDNAHLQAFAAQPLDRVARQVAQHIRAIRPHVVITFDPLGGYGHPDHIAIHRATVEAIRIAGDAGQSIRDLRPYAPQKLYYSTFSRRFLRGLVWLMPLLRRDPRHFGVNKDIDLVSLTQTEFPIHATISIGKVAHLKERAIACHASQGETVKGPAGWVQRWMGRNEMFMRAIPSVPPLHLERDLFEGVDGDAGPRCSQETNE